MNNRPIPDELVNVTFQLPLTMRKAFKAFAAEKDTRMQALLSDFVERWIAWAREGGEKPAIVGVPEPVAPPISAKVIRAARAASTTLLAFVSELQSDLLHSSDGDGISISSPIDDPEIRELLERLAVLLQKYGGDSDENASSGIPGHSGGGRKLGSGIVDAEALLQDLRTDRRTRRGKKGTGEEDHNIGDGARREA